MTAVSLGGVDRAELPDYVNPADLWDGRRQVCRIAKLWKMGNGPATTSFVIIFENGQGNHVYGMVERDGRWLFAE